MKDKIFIAYLVSRLHELQHGSRDYKPEYIELLQKDYYNEINEIELDIKKKEKDLEEHPKLRSGRERKKAFLYDDDSDLAH